MYAKNSKNSKIVSVFQPAAVKGFKIICSGTQVKQDNLQWNSGYTRLFAVELRPFHYGKKSTFSDFHKNHTTEVSLLMELKSAGIVSISCFVSKLEGKQWFPNYF